MEKAKRCFGTVVMSVLFLSMFFSFITSLSQNIHTIDVKMASVSQLVVDYDEQELMAEQKILPGKNVIETRKLLLDREPAQGMITVPKRWVPVEIAVDIYFPPKAVAV